MAELIPELVVTILKLFVVLFLYNLICHRNMDGLSQE